ncbi:MAG: WG repeat-containing protein [Dysgonomonas sp.]
MKNSIVLYIGLCLSSVLYAQDVYIFEKDNQFGLKNEESKTIVKAFYDYMYPLSTNFFLTEKNKRIGVVSKSGKVILEPAYDNIQLFGDDYFLVTLNDKSGIMDRFNRTILPIEYTGFTPITDYLYSVDKNGKKGLINKYGSIVIPALYEDITGFSEHLLLIKGNNNLSLVDDLGNIILTGNFNAMEKLPVSDLFCVKVGNKLGVIDLSGKVIANPNFDEVDCQNPEYIVLKQNGKVGFIINKRYIPAIYDKIVFTQDDLGVIAVRTGKLNGFITTNGLIVPPVYENMSRFSAKGHAFVEKKGKLMYVDINGKERTLQEVSGQRRF